MRESHIVKENNVLVVLRGGDNKSLVEEFCGSVILMETDFSGDFDFAGKSVYLCGDISTLDDLEIDLKEADRVRVVRQRSQDFNEDGPWQIVDLGQVPIDVHGVGILYRRFFDPERDYFADICSEHVFQSLTESNKPGTAFRTGIYLSPVEQRRDGLHFNLLRCSTNLSGPTENFRATDTSIVNALNQEADHVLNGHAPLNHVLAQVYHNTPATDSKKQTKARIKSHADKTKDMPANGIMAFCTFYQDLDKLERLDEFDYGCRKTSGLTNLVFRLKPVVAERPDCSLPEQFTVTLYPGSVFLMPLSTNRLYTHEIRPSPLDASQLPTRLGYVVRCSNTKAIHKDGSTYLQLSDQLVKLEEPTPEGMDELRAMYAEENKTDDFVDYGNRFLFSMNKGDYTAPDYRVTDEFRCYQIPVGGDSFDELQRSVTLENLGKGRRGNVLVQPDESRGVPIVRTTSQFSGPAQIFSLGHSRLAAQIRNAASLPVAFNNALIEVYTNAYAKMGFHSDQALDLIDESNIALFSCYKNPELVEIPRKLIVHLKGAEGDTFEIPLLHNSVVVFSLETNRRFKHSIVLDKNSNPPENEWLGLTFRTSGTFIKSLGDQAMFEDGTPLMVADDDQRKEFYSLRGRENRETDFNYPPLKYTISESDTGMPAKLKSPECVS